MLKGKVSGRKQKVNRKARNKGIWEGEWFLLPGCVVCVCVCVCVCVSVSVYNAGPSFPVSLEVVVEKFTVCIWGPSETPEV